MPKVVANDVRLHYEVAGEGPPLVFVHGMCGWAGVWSGQVARLSDEFTCVTYDRRGHGVSADGEVSHTVALHGDDFAALVSALELPSAVVVGSSGGGRVALDVVLRHGHLLAGAVLSEPPVFVLAPDLAGDFLRRVVPAVQPRLEANDLRGAVDGFFDVVCPGLWSRLDDEGKEPYRANASMLVADLGQPPFPVTKEDLDAVRLPILAVAGLDSDPFLQSTPRILAASIRSAQLIELSDCGHVTYAEQPDAFASALREFAHTVFAAA